MTVELPNPLVFSQASSCPLINGDVTLLTNTWEQHIKTKHPEVAGSLQHIQNTIANSAYVAQSLLGPNQSHADNVVFVSLEAKIRTSTLHVFVESPKAKPTISTAMYLKKRHAAILWENRNEKIKVSYDQDADVLYISKDDPVPSLTEEGDDGLLLRYSISSDKPSGVTVVSFRQLWSQHHAELVVKVSEFLGVTRATTEHALTSFE